MGTLKSEQFAWNDERIDSLKAMYAEGLSGGQIAAELGITRNAAIGKISRLGLTRDTHPSSANHSAQTKRRPAPRRHAPFRVKPAPVLPPPEPMPDTPDDQIPSEQRRTLMELTENTCRYPVGDPQLEDFFFCGAQPLGGSVYCGQHHALCYAGHGRVPERVAMWGRARSA